MSNLNMESGSESESDFTEHVTTRVPTFRPDMDMIYNYAAHKLYPPGMGKDPKREIRRKAKQYIVRSGKLHYKHHATRKGEKEVKELLVVQSEEEQRNIVKSVHMGLGDSDTSRAMAGHLGIAKTRDKILERFYWKNITDDVKSFISCCDRCQKVNPINDAEVAELHPVPVQPEVMTQIGVDITSITKTTDGYRYVVVAVDYYSKWTEARALKDKKAESVAKFLFEDILCRHGCVKIQINDQGREFVNKVSTISLVKYRCMLHCSDA